jgi:hypothetical protein
MNGYTNKFWGLYVDNPIPLPVIHGFIAGQPAPLRGADLHAALYYYRLASIPRHGNCDVSGNPSAVTNATGHHTKSIRLTQSRLVKRNILWDYKSDEHLYAIGRGNPERPGRLTNLTKCPLGKALKDIHDKHGKISAYYFLIPREYVSQEAIALLMGKGSAMELALGLVGEAQHNYHRAYSKEPTNFLITIERMKEVSGISNNGTLIRAINKCEGFVATFVKVQRDRYKVCLLNPCTKKLISVEKAEVMESREYPDPFPTEERAAYLEFIRTQIPMLSTQSDSKGEYQFPCTRPHTLSMKHRCKEEPKINVEVHKSRWGRFICFTCKHGGSMLDYLAERRGVSTGQIKKEITQYIQQRLGKESR